MFAPRDSQFIGDQLLVPAAGSAAEPVTYRLAVEDDAIVVEREVRDKQAVSHRLFTTASTPEELRTLLLDDETFGEPQRHLAQRLLRTASPYLADRRPPPLPDDPFELLAALTPGASQARVTAVLQRLGALARLPGVLAIWLRRHGEHGQTLTSTRLLAGAAWPTNPVWARAMVHKRWCVTDPLVTHARVRNEVVGSWQLARRSPGQEAAARRAAECGFQSSVCVPAHEAGGQATLALIYGGATPPEPRRLEHQIAPLLQAAAMRLLTWARERRWREEHGAVALTGTQQRILTLLAQDFTTMDIAKVIAEPEGRITYHVKRLRGIFGARSGVEVAMRAMEAGLIDPLDPG